MLDLQLEDIKNGYIFNNERNIYSCIICDKEFEVGQVYQEGEKFYDANKAVINHISANHKDRLDHFFTYNKKYTTLTDKQKELLKAISSGMNDKDISDFLGIARSTVRYQRYSFKEKAKQAKMYLAIYETAMKGAKSNIRSEHIDIHKGAKMIDDRYSITKEEEEKILSSMFSSLSPLKLKVFSSKEKKKIVILKKIAEQFEKDKHYSEKEVNEIIKEIYDDISTIRRYLITYGFMARTSNGSDYWIV